MIKDSFKISNNLCISHCMENSSIALRVYTIKINLNILKNIFMHIYLNSYLKQVHKLYCISLMTNLCFKIFSLGSLRILKQQK